MLNAVRGALVAAMLLAVLIVAAPATAAPCNPSHMECEPGGGGGTPRSISHDLTVTRTQGVVTSSPTGINCHGGASPDCTHRDTQIVQCPDGDCEDPDPNLWQTLTLTAGGGPAGFSPSWSNCPSVNGSQQCVVKMDATRTVTLGWVDTQNPTVALTSPANGATTGSMLGATATASDNAGVHRVEFRVNGIVRESDTTAPYQASISMAAHAHGSEVSVSATAFDVNGRATTSGTATVTVDKQVNLAVSDPQAFANGATVPVDIATDADADMTCKVVGAPAAAPCDGPTWSGVDASTPDGSYTYEVKATDAVGNTTTRQRSFVLDRTLPDVDDFDGPSEGSQVTTSGVAFTWEATDANLDDARCKLDSGPLAPCDGPTSHQVSGLGDGAHTFTLVVDDKAGNETTRTRRFSVKLPSQGTNTGTTNGNTGSTGGNGASTAGGAAPAANVPPRPLTTLPSAQGGGASEKPALAKLAYRLQRRGGRTRLVGLAVQNVPQGATIVVTCKGKGKGCPRKPLRLTRRSGTVKLTSLARRRFRKGAALTVTISAPGMTPQTLTVSIKR